jgi:signal transduction histidine kinase
LFQQDKTRQIAELQTQYETEKKEKEISIQNLQLSEHELTLERNQALIIGLIVLLILLSIVFILQRSRTQLKEQKAREQQQRKHQEELTQSVIDLQERERARFAQDLHDGFGQMVTTLKFQLESPNAEPQNTSALLSQMHDEIRNVSFALWPQVLVRDGLVQAIQELADRLNKSGKVLIEIKTLGLTGRLNSNTEITLYRICQEWLTNILKHSGSTKITIQLVAHPDELVFTIEDNGHGFDPLQLEKGKGNGWKNIQSRANLLKAELDLDTQVNRMGTIFTVALPHDTENRTREVA